MSVRKSDNSTPDIRVSRAGVHYLKTSDILQSEPGREAIDKMDKIFNASTQHSQSTEKPRPRTSNGN